MKEVVTHDTFVTKYIILSAVYPACKMCSQK